MKELSNEDKAKRYDEAYKVAKNIHIFSSDLAGIKRMEEIFPELKEESEDERIRKKICKILWDNVPYEEAQEYITWLEKQCENKSINNLTQQEAMDIAVAKCFEQGEQKPVIEMKTPEESLGIDSDTYNKIVDECIYGEQKHIDNVEPKFHEGDWVVYNNNGCICQIKSIRENDYCLWPLDSDVEGYFKTTYIDNEYHLWTIQEAKECDVLASNRSIFIFSQEYMAGKPEAHCGIMNGLFIVKPEGCWTNEKCYPATKEQRDTLIKAMADAGYTFDFEKKELKKIEQKSAWSEEDEERFESCIKVLQTSDGYDTINAKWLKSLKDRVLPKSTWNEEDESMLNFVKVVLNKHKNDAFFDKFETTLNDCLTWFRNIKSRVGCEVNCTTTKEWSKEDEVKMNRIVACLENLNVADNDILLKDVDWLKSLKYRVQLFPR